jgi:tetratricopeptide (TPR) repeat protein
MRARLALVLLLALVASAPASAQTPAVLESARAAVSTYHEDPARLDRAIAQLTAELARDHQVPTMVWLSRLHFTAGDVRATTTEEKLAAYDRGREIGRRAVELAPRNAQAHLWYAINTARWGQTKGIMRSLFLVPTVREELAVIFDLDPRLPEAHALAGGVYFELPALFGGDRAKAEAHYKQGLQIDPHFTVLRVDLARLYLATGRPAEARRELQRVLDERAPTKRADWTVKDVPRARTLLETLPK